MDTDKLLTEINALARPPMKDRPGNWAALAHKFSQLNDYLAMGGRPPRAWQTEAWKPYTHERCSCDGVLHL